MTTPDRPARVFSRSRARSGELMSEAGSPAFDDVDWLRWMLVPAFALMLASAWWCTGFIQGDEHFQVLEFASARLGLSRIADLPWEYAARARSWLLPAIAAGLRGAMIAIGRDDPFFCAFLLRAASGALYLAAVWRLARATAAWFRSRAQWRVAVVLGFGLWFVPVVAARFSAESWSGSLFFLAFVTLVRLRDRRQCSAAEIILAGLALGLAFVVRFPVLLLDAGAIVWLLRARVVTRREWGFLAVGAVVALAVGAVIDAWGYGAVSLPLWNYYKAQVPGGVLQSYGVSPWWWYFPATVRAAGWPIGLLLLAGFAGLCARRQPSALVWTLVPFVLFHMMVGHKEVRFLFPMLAAAPYVIVLGVEAWWPADFFSRHLTLTWALATLLVVANAAVLVARLAIPMEPRVAVQETVYRSGVSTVIVAGDHDPYVWWGLRSNWYRPANLRVFSVTDAEAARNLAASMHALIVTRAPERPDSAGSSCRIVHESAPARVTSPAWSALLIDFMPERDREPGWWFVARCDPVAGAVHTG